MARRPGLLAGALAVGLSCAASAYADPAYEGWLLRMGDYETLANVWRADTDSGDGAQQERLAELFLGPHARAAKARPFEGIHNLYWAALRGRRGAVLSGRGIAVCYKKKTLPPKREVFMKVGGGSL
ncbi:hypothetical protein ACEN88_28215, partial [Massilia sp. CT11-108]|uniref:hypothetical protein n=1 Tax=Massilia sp. CT11-108 TaxID=3393900 RepID=UPI0039A6E77A